MSQGIKQGTEPFTRRLEMPSKYEFKTQISTGYLIYGILVMISVFTYFFVQGKLNFENNTPQMWAVVIFCIYITYNLMHEPTSQLKAFFDHVIISGTGWQFNHKIPNEFIISLQSVTNAPFKDYWFLPLLFVNSKYGWKPGSKWYLWIPSHFIFFNDNAIAIETTDRKFLIACPDPDTAVKKLREIIGL